MASEVSSMRFLEAYPEIMRWIADVEAAAGPRAWTNIKIDKRNGRLDNVQVICVIKCEEQKRP